MDRRTLLGLLAIGAADVLVGCASPADHVRPAAPRPTPTPRHTTRPRVRRAAVRPLPPIPAAHPGPPVVTYQAAHPTRQIALTIDDGYSPETVAGYVEFARRSGIPITFNPNGCYEEIWNPHATALRPLIEAGKVQIGNHTFSHADLVTRGDAAIRADIERNEDWIQRTFGITSRPWFRPPYGSHSLRTDSVAAELGWTRILLWNGSYGDSRLLKPEVLLDQARQYLQLGTIMLGHANHTTILGLFAQVERLIAERRLEPVTLDTMFGTSRAIG